MTQKLEPGEPDEADLFRAAFGIRDLDTARLVEKNLDLLWNTVNPWNSVHKWTGHPWSKKGHIPDRDSFDRAGHEVVQRFEFGEAKKAKAADSFSQRNPIAMRKDVKFKAINNTPDVCRTPNGAAMPPVPYQLTADLVGTMGAVESVRFNGHPAYVLKSIVPTCVGDEAGSGGGVRSGTTGGMVAPTQGSGTVKINRYPVVRDGHPCLMNNGNCTGIYAAVPFLSGSIDSDGKVSGNANPPPHQDFWEQVGGFFVGAGKAVWEMFKGAAKLAAEAEKLPVSAMSEGLSRATGWYEDRSFTETTEAFKNTVEAIYHHPQLLVDAYTKPYVEAWKQGKYGEAIGRGVADVALFLSMFVDGAGVAGEAGEVAGVSGELSEAANNVGRVGSELGKLEEGSNLHTVLRLRGGGGDEDVVESGTLTGVTEGPAVKGNGVGNTSGRDGAGSSGVDGAAGSGESKSEEKGIKIVPRTRKRHRLSEGDSDSEDSNILYRSLRNNEKDPKKLGLKPPEDHNPEKGPFAHVAAGSRANEQGPWISATRSKKVAAAWAASRKGGRVVKFRKPPNAETYDLTKEGERRAAFSKGIDAQDESEFNEKLEKRMNSSTASTAKSSQEVLIKDEVPPSFIDEVWDAKKVSKKEYDAANEDTPGFKGKLRSRAKTTENNPMHIILTDTEVASSSADSPALPDSGSTPSSSK